MPAHVDLPFSDWHKGRFAAGTEAQRDTVPEGIGDLYYAYDSQFLYISNADATDWFSYDFSYAGVTIDTLADFEDVDSAAQTANFVLATGDGTTGGNYRGRLLVSADIPNLAATQVLTGTFPVSQGGTGLSFYDFADLLVGNASGTLSRVPVGTDGQYVRVYLSGFSNGFSSGFGITNAFSSGLSAGFSIAGAVPGIRYETVDTGNNSFVGCSAYLDTATIVTAPSDVAFTAIPFDVDDFDTSAFHDPGVNPTRFTVPTAGYYALVLALTISGAPVQSYENIFACQIYLDGTTVIAETTGSDQLSTLYLLSAGQYVEARFRSYTGFTISGETNRFSIYRISLT